MDLFNQLGPLALGSRFRRLTDLMAQDVATVYKDMNIDFEPRWFMIYYLLSQKSPLSIVDVSRTLGISHPCVNQIANDMIKAGMVKQLKDKTDKRKRLLALSEKGLSMLPKVQPVWDGMEAAVRNMIASTGVDVMGMLEKIEKALDEQSLHDRYLMLQKRDQAAEVQIVDYSPQYGDAFHDINVEWISRYFVVEPEDEKMLRDPENQILAKGGHILYALCHDPQTGKTEVLGTCALLKKSDRLYELGKMGVTEKARGKQIGKMLLNASIEKARALGADMMMLETNSKLTPALNLYRKVGFEMVPFEATSKYVRADVCMQLTL